MNHIKLGRPRHMLITAPACGFTQTACGLMSNSTSPTFYGGYDARDTDCLRCRSTKAYKIYMGKPL